MMSGGMSNDWIHNENVGPKPPESNKINVTLLLLYTPIYT